MSAGVTAQEMVIQIDRKLSIGLLLSLLGMFAGGVTWISHMSDEMAKYSERLEQIAKQSEITMSHERRLGDLEIAGRERGDVINRIAQDLAAIKQNQANVKEGLDGVNRRLDQIFQPWTQQHH